MKCKFIEFGGVTVASMDWKTYLCKIMSDDRSLIYRPCG
jgi:hypothetical protein